MPSPDSLTRASMADNRPLGPVGWFAAVWLGLVLMAALAGPWLPLPDSNAQGACTTKQPKQELGPDGQPVVRDGRIVLIAQPGCDFQQAANDKPAALPSSDHLLGNDQIGRDLLSRLMAGARTTVVIAFGSMIVALLVGGVIGMTSAFVGGRIDVFITALSAGTIAIPGIVLAISLVAALGRNTFAVWLALTVTGIPIIALVTRTQTSSLIRRDYVTAAQMLGARPSRVLFREVAPNVAPFCLVFFGLGVAAAIGAEGGLAVIGLSVQPPQTSWGSIIAGGRPLIQLAPHISLIPAVVMFLTIFSVTRLTDYLGDRLGVRQSLL